MITSVNNQNIKYVSRLSASAKARREENAFIVEGERIACEIPPDRVKMCLVSESFMAKESAARLPEHLAKCAVFETVSDGVFKKMSDTMTPQGIICAVKMDNTPADDFLNRHKSGRFNLLLLENIQDPGNLGTMIRTAEGAGFDGIIADSGTVDVYNPKVIRSTMGAIFRLPVMYVKDMKETVKRLKDDGVGVCAAHLDGKRDYWAAQYSDRIAVAIGNEGNGLSAELSDMCDIKVIIPMEGKLESLNASVAAALLMYEVKRRR